MTKKKKGFTMRAVNPAVDDDYADFVVEHDIKMDSHPIDSRPGWPEGSTHWQCTMTKGRKRMSFRYSMGPSHRGSPQSSHALEALVVDAATYDRNSSVDDIQAAFKIQDRAEAQRLLADLKTNHHKLIHLVGQENAEQLMVDADQGRISNPEWLDTSEHPKGWTALGAFVGSALGLLPGAALGSGLLAGLGAIAGGGVGGHYMAPDDRKQRGAFGGAMGGFVLGPLGAAAGGAIGGRKPDKKGRKNNPLKNKLLR